MLGKHGYHALYNWFEAFCERRFPDPMGLRSRLKSITLGFYPRILKYAMAIFDLPEAIAVARISICHMNGKMTQLSRLQV